MTTNQVRNTLSLTYNKIQSTLDFATLSILQRFDFATLLSGRLPDEVFRSGGKPRRYLSSDQLDHHSTRREKTLCIEYAKYYRKSPKIIPYRMQYRVANCPLACLNHKLMHIRNLHAILNEEPRLV